MKFGLLGAGVIVVPGVNRGIVLAAGGPALIEPGERVGGDVIMPGETPLGKPKAGGAGVAVITGIVGGVV